MSALSKLFDGYHPLSRFCLTCSPAPPASPNFQQAAQQQADANTSAAITQGKINNPNVVSPCGTQTVTWGGGFDQVGFDNATKAWNKQVSDYSNAWNDWNAKGRSGPFNMDVGFGAGVDPRHYAPDRNKFSNREVPTITQTLSPDQQKILDTGNKTKIGLSELALQGTDIAKGVLGKSLDFSQLPARPGSAEDTRTKVMDAMMARVNEDVDRQKGQLNSSLYASGIAPGSKAYDDAMALTERSRTDARNQALLASGQEMTRDFQTDSARRREALGELLTQRQTPLNEINALQSGSQINNPFSVPGYAQNAQVGAAPIFGATQATGDWNADLYNAKAAQAGNLQQGLFGLGAAGIQGGMMMASDIRLKSNIKRVGTHPLGVGWYEYDIAGRREQGVMAQEVLEVKPEAVGLLPSGHYGVYYGRLA